MALVAACGPANTPDQTLVTGDKFEITITELEQVLRAAPLVRKDEIAPARRFLLDRLIAQKLFAEAGAADGLDKDPDVLQQLVAAKRAIMADAYVRHLTEGRPAPTRAQIAAYYRNNPDQFQARKRLLIREFAIAETDPAVPRYSAILDREGFDALAARMAGGAMKAEPAIVTRWSNEVPEGRRGAVAGIKAGSDILYRTPGMVHLGRLEEVSPAPMDIASATPQISERLKVNRRAETVRMELEDLRAARHVRVVNADLARTGPI